MKHKRNHHQHSRNGSNQHHQQQENVIYGLVSMRVMITGTALAGIGDKLTILPIEVVDHDRHLQPAEIKELTSGIELKVSKGMRNAGLKVEPYKGEKFVVLFDKDSDGSDPRPANPGDECVLFAKIISSVSSPQKLDDRFEPRCFAGIESYSKAQAAAAGENAKLPQLREAIEEEGGTLWRMTSETRKLSFPWATPEKIKEGLQRHNGNMVPTDAKWFKKSPNIGKKIIAARKKNPNADVLKLMTQLNTGEESATRPPLMALMRTGNYEPRVQQHGGQKKDFMSAEQLRVLENHRPSDGSEKIVALAPKQLSILEELAAKLQPGQSQETASASA